MNINLSSHKTGHLLCYIVLITSCFATWIDTSEIQYFFMIILDDVFIPMLLTYLIDNILYYIRCLLGDCNVAKKAVVDDRFLN